jgi:hypothetical protein
MIKWTLGQMGKTKPIQTQYKANFKPYLAKMGNNELKYVDRLAQLTLNLQK